MEVKVCLRCGKRYRSHAYKKRKYCSSECFHRDRGNILKGLR